MKTIANQEFSQNYFIANSHILGKSKPLHISQTNFIKYIPKKFDGSGDDDRV